MKKLDKIISRFKKTRILVIGDLILDEFIWGKVERISPEAPVPVVRAEKRTLAPGGASNVAANIASLGGKAAISGITGKDIDGKTLLALLEKKGIDTSAVLTDKKVPTSVKTRIIAHHQQVVRLDREANRNISRSSARKIIASVKKKIASFDAVLLEDYGKGVVIPYLLKEIVSLARRHRKIITIDPKEDHFSYYQGVDAITPNRDEASQASGIKIKDKKTLLACGKKLLADLSPRALLITRGEEGMTLFEKSGGLTHIPTVAQEVYDVSGAGDTVIAAFTLALASGATMKEAALISNYAAGVVVGKMGVATVGPLELKKSILSR